MSEYSILAVVIIILLFIIGHAFSIGDQYGSYLSQWSTTTVWVVQNEIWHELAGIKDCLVDSIWQAKFHHMLLHMLLSHICKSPMPGAQMQLHTITDTGCCIFYWIWMVFWPVRSTYKPLWPVHEINQCQSKTFFDIPCKRLYPLFVSSGHFMWYTVAYQANTVTCRSFINWGSVGGIFQACSEGTTRRFAVSIQSLMEGNTPHNAGTDSGTVTGLFSKTTFWQQNTRRKWDVPVIKTQIIIRKWSRRGIKPCKLIGLRFCLEGKWKKESPSERESTRLSQRL